MLGGQGVEGGVSLLTVQESPIGSCAIWYPKQATDYRPPAFTA